jgi:hypothetical protein
MSNEPSPTDKAPLDPVDHLLPVLTIRLWPKIPVLYPMALIAFIAGILMWKFPAETHPKIGQVCGIVFLAVTGFSLFTITFDIGLTWALLWVAGILIVGLVMTIINIFYPFLPDFFNWLNHLSPIANSHFYFCIFTIWALLMILGIVLVNFHYVRIEPNEVIVVGGVMDKRRRYSTMRVTYTKEVHDVFEYYLPFVRSGSLIMRFPNEDQPLILENVMNIDKVIKQLEHITSTLTVSEAKSD